MNNRKTKRYQGLLKQGKKLSMTALINAVISLEALKLKIAFFDHRRPFSSREIY